LSTPTINENHAERGDYIGQPLLRPEDLRFVRGKGNPLGVKGGSESGTIGAPAAIGNAVIDALWHLGVRDITLPIRPEKVWRALRAAKNTRSLQ
jgi:hypothetical protein